ncbi:MAG TPA: zf-HC2 domain-containing protein [Candidatus Wallbacteria bacterium]|nr:zf-HC2 domain-containing protein [Candidatus Wallbacteria bacterium]
MDDTAKKCSGMEDNIILYVDGELSEAEKRNVERHIESCSKCRKLHESYAKLDKAASALFVSERPLVKVRIQKTLAQKILEMISGLAVSQRFAFQTAVLAAFIFSAFFLYHGFLGPKLSSKAVLGRFVCPRFQAGVELEPVAGYFGAGEIFDGATVKAIETGTFSSDKFNVTFKSGAQAKLGANGIKLIAGAIDIDYFKKPAPVDFEISTPNSLIFIRGTRLAVSYLNSVTEVSVVEGRVAVMKKSGELILVAGDGAIIKKDGEPWRLTKNEIHVDMRTGELELKKNNDHKALDTLLRIDSSRSEKTGPVEITVKNNNEGTQPVVIEKGPVEKLFDYEVDLNSMDEKTRRLFFKNKPR